MLIPMHRLTVVLLILSFTGCAATPFVSIRVLEQEEKTFREDFQLSPMEESLIRSSDTNASLQGIELLEASFIASGTTNPSEVRDYSKQLSRFEAQVRLKTRKVASSQRKVAQVLLRELHAQFLRTYRPRQSKTVVALNDGVYNCVSATTLFNGMLHRFGIESQVVDSPTHVLSRALIDGHWVEVETTNARGFNPFRSEEEYRAFLKSRDLRSGYQRMTTSGGVEAVLIPRSTSKRRVVDNRLLPGFIVWNDAIIAAEDGDRKRAWKLYEMATRMLPNEESVRRNADVFLNNLAFQHMENQAYDKALRLLLFANHAKRGEKVKSNIRIMMIRSFDRLGAQAVQRSDIAELEDILRFAHAKMGKTEVLEHNHPIHVGNLAKQIAAQGKVREGLDLLSRHMKWDLSFLSNRYAHLVSKEASSLQSQGETEAAKRLLEREIPYLTGIGGDPNNLGVLEEMLGIYFFKEDKLEEAIRYFRRAISHGNGSSARSNLGVSLFNIAVQAFNEGDCERALRFVQKTRPYSNSSTLNRIEMDCRR
jgi:tetratricopeptide (TPR) repeat protein